VTGYVYWFWTDNGIAPDLMQDECIAPCNPPVNYYPTLNPVLMKSDMLMYDTVCYNNFYKDVNNVWNAIHPTY